MQLLFTAMLFFSIKFKVCSQLLQGDWTGTFSGYDGVGRTSIDYSTIRLKFLLNNNIYSVYSYSKGQNAKGNDTTVVCKVYYELIAKDSIYLEEVEIIEPQNIKPICMQKMYLKILKRKKVTILKGLWESESDQCPIQGTINFRRKEH